MTHADAFLQAIFAAPDDDAPRLIFADWLEERGDPRGPFIRLQCALERLGPADPARADLEDEAQALLEKHEEEWTAPLRGVASEWRFRRGFVDEIVLPADAFAARGETVLSSFPVRKVRISDLPRTRMGVLAGCPHLSRVRVLDLAASGLRDEGVEKLLTSPHLAGLTGLDLSGNQIEWRAVRAVAAWPGVSRLTWLNLNHNHHITPRAASTLAQAPAAALQFLGLSFAGIGLNGLRDVLNSPTLTGLTSLQAASIGHYGLAGVPAAALAEAPVLARLTSLDLGGFAGPGGLPLLLRSPALGRLTSLGLSGCWLPHDGARALAESPHLAGLTTLDLSRNSLGPDSAQALAESPHLAGLVALELGYNAVCDRGARALAESPHLKGLTSLGLRRNAVGGPGLRALASSPSLCRLTMLDVSENYVGIGSVRALAASPHLSRLTCLRIENCRLEPAAARALAGSPHLARLTALHLDNNDIADEGLRALLYSPHLTRLTELSVRSNFVGKAGADAVSAMLANSPRLARLKRLDLFGNPLSDVERRALTQRFGARVEL